MYNSPIRIITSDLGMKVTEDLDEQIYQSVLNVGIAVDKGELLRALKYDRGQYEKGYADGKADAAPEWISVKDRLPDEECRCLVIDAAGDIEMDLYDGKGRFILYRSGAVQHPSHWMPLPEPLKGE